MTPAGILVPSRNSIGLRILRGVIIRFGLKRCDSFMTESSSFMLNSAWADQTPPCLSNAVWISARSSGTTSGHLAAMS